MDNQIQGPAWDLSSEYTATDAAELQADLDQVLRLCDAIEALNPELDGPERISKEAAEIFGYDEELWAKAPKLRQVLTEIGELLPANVKVVQSSWHPQ